MKKKKQQCRVWMVRWKWRMRGVLMLTLPWLRALQTAGLVVVALVGHRILTILILGVQVGRSVAATVVLVAAVVVHPPPLLW